MDIYRLVYTIFRRCALYSLFLFQFIPAGGNTRFLWQDQLLPRYDMVHIVQMIERADFRQPL